MRAALAELAVGDLPALFIQVYGALTIFVEPEAEKVGKHRTEILDLCQLQRCPRNYQA